MVKKILAVTIILLAIIFIVVILSNSYEEPLEHVMVDSYGQPMIDFELNNTDSKLYSVTSDSGKPKLLNFWTSWCQYCKEEAEHLNEIYSNYKDDLEIVSINLTSSDNKEEAMDFIKKYNFEFPILLDYEGTIASQYRITAIPTNYFVNSDGTIKAITYNLTTSNSKNLIEELIRK
ncbi:TlpA disulfide reductase family protein [Cohnella herbarum]|uniref:TlpA family protein disulfide reductase n=1 Tax=Cohnella herbarum TaxID=2728023 RepID=A0A7Z2VHF9_9BACL|nr:TlpA disulfide reductase family protein [Cohnella herbarum]QJD83253.1 TlpA family protein disulfide reductase [Cohnella herbarum]